MGRAHRTWEQTRVVRTERGGGGRGKRSRADSRVGRINKTNDVKINMYGYILSIRKALWRVRELECPPSERPFEEFHVQQARVIRLALSIGTDTTSFPDPGATLRSDLRVARVAK